MSVPLTDVMRSQAGQNLHSPPWRRSGLHPARSAGEVFGSQPSSELGCRRRLETGSSSDLSAAKPPKIGDILNGNFHRGIPEALLDIICNIGESLIVELGKFRHENDMTLAFSLHSRE